MNTFEINEDGRVLINGKGIDNVLGFHVHEDVEDDGTAKITLCFLADRYSINLRPLDSDKPVAGQ